MRKYRKSSEEEILNASMSELQVITTEEGMHKALELRAVPYIGQYGFDSFLNEIGSFYKWFVPNTVLKPTKLDIVHSFPPLVKRAVYDFSKKYPSGQIEFFVINSTGKYFHDDCISKNLSCCLCVLYWIGARFNYVLHPYIFNGYGQYKDISVHVYLGLYKICEYDPIYPSAEYQGMPINPQNLLDKENLIEVHIHPAGESMAISPNNAAFLMSALSPVLSFFGVCAIPYKGGSGKLVISLHTVVFDYELPLIRHLPDLMDRSKLSATFPKATPDSTMNKTYVSSLEPMYHIINENIRNVFSRNIELFLANPDKETALESALEQIGLTLYMSHLGPGEKFVARSFVEGFYEFYNQALMAVDMPGNFAKEFFKSHGVEYQIELIKKYMRHIMQRFTNTATIQMKMLAQFDSKGAKSVEIKKEVIEIQRERFPPNAFFDQYSGRAINPHLKDFEAYLEALMANNSKISDALFKTLTKPIQEYIFFQTWAIRGKLKGLHNEFGRCAFMEIHEISDHYFLTQEEKIELMLRIQELFKSNDDS